MSDQELTDDERELVRLVAKCETARTSFYFDNMLDGLFKHRADVLAHYRKAKADAFERGRYYTPPPIDPGSDPGAHHA